MFAAVLAALEREGDVMGLRATSRTGSVRHFLCARMA